MASTPTKGKGKDHKDKDSNTVNKKDKNEDKKGNDDKSLASLVFPLDEFVAKIPQMFDCLPLPNGDDGTNAAFVTTLSTLQRLYQQLTLPRWRALRKRVRVGLIKETRDFGNTSVSCGIAVEYFEKLAVQKPDSLTQTNDLLVLNCGTGGVKYQLLRYAKAEKRVSVLEEIKPKAASSSPNDVQVQDETGKVLFNRLMNVDGCKTGILRAVEEIRAKNPQIPHILAVVTGPIRAAWEEATSQDRDVFDNHMKAIFSSFATCQNGSYFITQEEEGRLELQAARSMYANLVEAKILDEGEPCISFGIGMGSTQWAAGSTEKNSRVIKKAHLIGVPLGMGATHVSLPTFDEYLLSQLKGTAEAQEAFFAALESTNFPVIALKSGCLLSFEKNRDTLMPVLRPAHS
jgi:hypothetical protein